ncbi:MAG: hypothetical protein HZB17_07135 [Chloroflexi bacterium]|nr:hypothetical protein [Chloroflexota bacterium]
MSLLAGLITLFVGLLLLGRTFNVHMKSLFNAWPIAPLLFGIGFTFEYLFGSRKDSRFVLVGVGATLTSLFFFMFTLGFWKWDLSRYWVRLVLIVSLSFFAHWLADMNQNVSLMVAAISFTLTVFAMPYAMGEAHPTLTQTIAQLWPAIIVLAGLAIMARGFAQINRNNEQ